MEVPIKGYLLKEAGNDDTVVLKNGDIKIILIGLQDEVSVDEEYNFLDIYKMYVKADKLIQIGDKELDFDSYFESQCLSPEHFG